MHGGGRYSFPAEFLLVGAMNPAPVATIRTETAAIVENMRLKDISSGSVRLFLDRMDICVTTNAATYGEFRERYLTVTVYSGVQKICERSGRARLIQKNV